MPVFFVNEEKVRESLVAVVDGLYRDLIKHGFDVETDVLDSTLVERLLDDDLLWNIVGKHANKETHPCIDTDVAKPVYPKRGPMYKAIVGGTSHDATPVAEPHNLASEDKSDEEQIMFRLKSVAPMVKHHPVDIAIDHANPASPVVVLVYDAPDVFPEPAQIAIIEGFYITKTPEVISQCVKNP